MKTTSTYGAQVIDVMGSDLTVVNAARVSFDKESAWDVGFGEDEMGKYQTNVLAEKDAKLISYLASHNHWSPFSHPQLSFRVKAPIFVARQLQKHQVGLAWNEVSRRYVDSEPEFYLPEVWRKRADNVKQGSSDEESVDVLKYLEQVSAYWPIGIYEEAQETYVTLLAAGVCPEQARMVLPQSMLTEWIWTGSLYAFARVVNQRMDPHAQRECRKVAEDIEDTLRKHFPVSWGALKAKNEPT